MPIRTAGANRPCIRRWLSVPTLIRHHAAASSTDSRVGASGWVVLDMGCPPRDDGCAVVFRATWGNGAEGALSVLTTDLTSGVLGLMWWLRREGVGRSRRSFDWDGPRWPPRDPVSIELRSEGRRSSRLAQHAFATDLQTDVCDPFTRDDAPKSQLRHRFATDNRFWSWPTGHTPVRLVHCHEEWRRTARPWPQCRLLALTAQRPKRSATR
ncbi:hypothetical protein BN12_60021 [Nostocoides japonicum T1-X7]|uniref:Uncharacterized protein n=1 Tax=Nostocoides japonicum T1-X7 TaxID=1194083 RepID=A0A077M6Z5_9MICO|nr:hypothetical protein BN12_60021 [Tetrasphaera japonica T1-X7]